MHEHFIAHRINQREDVGIEKEVKTRNIVSKSNNYVAALYV
jgi:hypothetical protein